MRKTTEERRRFGGGGWGGVFERLQRELESQRGRDLDELVPVRGSVL